jgi:hypothetical protein
MPWDGLGSPCLRRGKYAGIFGKKKRIEDFVGQTYWEESSHQFNLYKRRNRDRENIFSPSTLKSGWTEGAV